jgi:transposase-like protein
MGNAEVDAMNAAVFRDWLAKADELTAVQRQRAIEALRQERRSAPDPLALVFDANRPCPHCQHAVCRPWGQAHGLPRFRCAACGKTFNALTGTPLARLRHRERWGEYAQALIDGQTVRAAACRCGVHKNTAFRWRHRFLALPAEVKPSHLHGIVEADETYFLESHKGERHLSRPPRKRGGVAAKRGLSDEQIPVLVVRDRNTTTTDAVLPRANTAAVRAVLGPIVDPDAVLCSDSSAIYRGFAEAAHIAHTAVNLSAGIRVIDHAFHIQNVNAYHGRLKGWMARFHGVATKYLPNYLGWRRFLERFASSLAPPLVLDLAVTGGQHLTQT